MEIYLVGGAVRDRLLGEPLGDKDWLVLDAGDGLLQSLGFQRVGRDFPIWLHPDTREEYAQPRGPDELTGEAALEADLERRDLTINAMAEDERGVLIDPFGGRFDLEQRMLRHVSGHFQDDPIRILRLARLAARYHGLGFTIAPETRLLCRRMVASGDLDELVPERVWAEISRALAGPDAWVFIRALRELGALKVILPEVEALFGVPQPENWHPEIDTGLHTLMCLEQAERLGADAMTRFAVLCHDLGKGTTPRHEWPSHKGHEARGERLVRAIAGRLPLPTDWTDLAVLTARFHTHCHRYDELRPATVVDTLRRLDALRRPQRFEQFLLACTADSRGRTGFEDSEYPQASRFRRALVQLREVPIEPLIERGLSGEAMGKALRQAYIRSVAAMAQA